MLKKLQAWGYLFSRNWSPHLEISCLHHLKCIGHKLTSIPTVPVPELGYDPADAVLEPLSSPTPKGLHTFQFGRTNLNPTKKSPSESLQTCPMRPDTRRQAPHLQYQSRFIFNVFINRFIFNEWKEALKPPPGNEQTTPHADGRHVTRASKISSRALFIIWLILRILLRSDL